MCERCPSDVFLELWRTRELQTPEAFRECAEAWMQIRELEMMARISQAGGASPSPTCPPESTPEGVQKVHPERVEKVHEGGAEISLSVGSADSSPQGEPVVQNEPGHGPETEKKLRDNAAAGKASLATRKKNALEKVRWLRLAQNRTMTDIVEADPELSLNVLLDFIDCEPIPLPKLAAIERAVKKLEAET